MTKAKLQRHVKRLKVIMDVLKDKEEDKMYTEWNHLIERTSPLCKPFSCYSQ